MRRWRRQALTGEAFGRNVSFLSTVVVGLALAFGLGDYQLGLVAFALVPVMASGMMLEVGCPPIRRLPDVCRPPPRVSTPPFASVSKKDGARVPGVENQEGATTGTEHSELRICARAARC